MLPIFQQTINNDSGATVELNQSFSNSILIIKVSNPYNKPSSDLSGYLIQSQDILGIGSVEVFTRQLNFNPKMIAFPLAEGEIYKLKIQLVFWLPSAIITIWQSS